MPGLPENTVARVIEGTGRGQSMVMDSREIAELTGKEHRNVCRDIEAQLGKLEGGVLRFGHTYRNEQNGQEYRCFRLPYRETMILVSGYSVELRARVVDRWMELERAQFRVPQTLPEALRLAADLAERVEALEPRAAVADKIAKASGLRTLSEFGKVMIGPRAIFDRLASDGIIYRQAGRWAPYQEHIDAGRFVVRMQTYEANGHDELVPQMYVTGKGEVWLAEKYGRAS